MKIEIDLSDIFCEESEESVREAIQDRIKHEVARTVWERVKSSVEDQITKQVTASVETQLETRIAATIDLMISAGEIVRSKEKIKITDHIQNLFNESYRWNSVGDQVKKLAEGYASDLKKRYDAVFANRIVVKINEQGMLKDDVARLLLEG